MKWVQLWVQLYSLNIFWHCPSLGLEWKLTLSSPVSIDESSKLLAYWFSTSTASSLGLWNNSAGIPSPPLSLFILMLPKAHLTSHSRMFGSRWVTTPSWLSRSLRTFLYSSSVYYCHLFLIFSASVRSLLFWSFIVPILAWGVPLISPIFLLIFLILLFSSISLHCSLNKAFSLLFSGTLHSSECISSFPPCL